MLFLTEITEESRKINTHQNQARRLSSILMARRSRWSQARLSPDQIRLEVAMECIGLILLGYRTSIIKGLASQ